MAHHVLLVLSTYADKDGRARPSLSTLADDARLTDRITAAALERLRKAELIKAAAELNGGITVWELNLDARRADQELTAAQARRDTLKSKAAARSANYRARKADIHAEVERDVTSSESVTNGHVTPLHGIRHAAPERTSRLATAYVTPSSPSQPQVKPATTAIELPTELPVELPAGEAAAKKGNTAYTADFEEFWSAYGKKGGKAAAATEWHKAIKRANPDVIMARVKPYVESTSGEQFRWRKDAERWLRNDGWESAIVPAKNSDGPFRNYADQNRYDEPLESLHGRT